MHFLKHRILHGTRPKTRPKGIVRTSRKEAIMATNISTFIQSLEQRRLLSSTVHFDGVGVIGDSYSDEYHFYPPDRSTAANWVEQLQQDSRVDFGRYFKTDPA